MKEWECLISHNPRALFFSQRSCGWFKMGWRRGSHGLNPCIDSFSSIDFKVFENPPSRNGNVVVTSSSSSWCCWGLLGCCWENWYSNSRFGVRHYHILLCHLHRELISLQKMKNPTIIYACFHISMLLRVTKCQLLKWVILYIYIAYASAFWWGNY